MVPRRLMFVAVEAHDEYRLQVGDVLGADLASPIVLSRVIYWSAEVQAARLRELEQRRIIRLLSLRDGPVA